MGRAGAATVDGFGRIFYRRRRVRAASARAATSPTSAAAGARSYRYMIMLDADSVMAGATLVRLVELMERIPTSA